MHTCHIGWLRASSRFWPTLLAGKNESEEKRELIFKEDGQGALGVCVLCVPGEAAGSRGVIRCIAGYVQSTRKSCACWGMAAWRLCALME